MQNLGLIMIKGQDCKTGTLWIGGNMRGVREKGEGGERWILLSYFIYNS
jgi:hypothetical protein